MDTKFLKIVLLITATQFLYAGSCNKDGSRPCTMLTPYSFTVTSEFSPQKEIYKVGDTIVLTSVFPKTLVNTISNQQVDYSNSLGIGGNFKIVYMDSANQTIEGSINKFKTSVSKGQQSPIPNSPNSGLNIDYLENTTTYEFTMSIELLSEGLYYMGVTDLASRGIRGKNCTNAGFDMTVTNDNKNLHLFENALGYPADAMLARSVFCFRVQ